MAWTHTTIDGLGIHPLVTVVQSELIRAVNERREALGLATVNFWYGDGTGEKAYPTAADFDGFPLLGADDPISPELQANLGKLQDEVKSMIAMDVFMTTSTSDTEYTRSGLIASVGLGDFPATSALVNFRNANTWQRLLNVLDYLLYVRRIIYLSNSISDGGNNANQNTSWTQAVSSPVSITSSAGFGWTVIRDSIGSVSYRSWVYQSYSKSVDFSTLGSAGVVTRESLTGVNHGATINATISTAMTIAGESFTNTINTQTVESRELSGVLSATVPVTINMTMDTSPPSTSPFDFSISSANGYNGLLSPGVPTLNLWRDLTTILSDQT